MCDLKTDKGAFRLGLGPSSTRRRFLPRSSKVGSGISSEEGIEESQKPMRPSQEQVNKEFPSECTEETGPVCRCSVARALEDEDPSSDRAICVIRAVWS